MPLVIALRASMDCVQAPEVNPCLFHKSTIEGLSHINGNDGQVACLLAGAAKLLDDAQNLP